VLAGGQGVVVPGAAGSWGEAGRAEEEGGVLVPADRHDLAVVLSADGDLVRVGTPAVAVPAALGLVGLDGGAGLGLAFALPWLEAAVRDVAHGARLHVYLGAVGCRDLAGQAGRGERVDDLLECRDDQRRRRVVGEADLPPGLIVSAWAAPQRGDGLRRAGFPRVA
jgi:hypothetical protein